MIFEMIPSARSFQEIASRRNLDRSQLRRRSLSWAKQKRATQLRRPRFLFGRNVNSTTQMFHRRLYSGGVFFLSNSAQPDCGTPGFPLAATETVLTIAPPPDSIPGGLFLLENGLIFLRSMRK